MKKIAATLIAALALSACWSETPKSSVISGGCSGSEWLYSVRVRATHSSGTWRILDGATHPALVGKYQNSQDAYATGRTSASSMTVRGTATSGSGQDAFTFGRTHDNPCR